MFKVFHEYCACFDYFFDSLRAEQWFLYQSGVDNVNETTFSSGYTLLAVLSIWKKYWMCFYIYYKKLVFVARYNLLPCRAADICIIKKK